MPPCRLCKTPFSINPEDLEFYGKIDVYAPTLCPDCRKIHVMTLRNERTFYNSTCALCRKDIISCFAQHTPFHVCCNECWWSDRFDPLAHGREFDFSRPFFEQFWEHMTTVPVGNLFSANSENSPYVNYSVNNKNCYMLIASDFNEDSLFADDANNNRDVCDVSFVNKAELAYECVDLVNCYACLYSQNLKDCDHCLASLDLTGCSQCIGCVGLRNAKYQIFNKQYTKEAYEEELKRLDLNTFTGTTRLLTQFAAFKTQKPRKYANNVNSVASTGNYLVNCKNCELCFDMYECENCKYSIFGYKTKDSYDIYGAPGSELSYGSVGFVQSYKVVHSCLVWPGSNDVYYSFLTREAKYCLGCVSLHNNQYCLLNKQYSPSDYTALFAKIKAHMKETGEWGEPLPLQYAPWAYNETIANDYYPRDRATALALGGRWEEKIPGTFGKETLTLAEMPDAIEDVTTDIIQQTLACGCTTCPTHADACGRNFKIVKQELAFYQKMHIPLPRHCPTCRYRHRVVLRNPRHLWDRQCDCTLANHEDHALGTRCLNKFATTFSPDRTEIIFCEPCHNKETY